MDPEFLLSLFLGVHLHQLIQPGNSPPHSLEWDVCIWQREFPPDQNEEYVEAAEIFESSKMGPCRI